MQRCDFFNYLLFVLLTILSSYKVLERQKQAALCAAAVEGGVGGDGVSAFGSGGSGGDGVSVFGSGGSAWGSGGSEGDDGSGGGVKRKKGWHCPVGCGRGREGHTRKYCPFLKRAFPTVLPSSTSQ